MSLKSFPPAILVLADGSIFRGTAIGKTDANVGIAVGEVVFNTAMAGYQEILTDPSYMGQIVTLTYPHIGNVGTNREDAESDKVYAAGLIIRDLPLLTSNFRSEETLHAYLVRNKIVAIADIDTRRLTRLTREKGAQNGCILVGATGDAAVAKAYAMAQAAPKMVGLDLAKVVSCPKPYEWQTGSWVLGVGYQKMDAAKFHVVAYDFGVKHNILRKIGRAHV